MASLLSEVAGGYFNIIGQAPIKNGECLMVKFENSINIVAALGLRS
jgi:hypothetical protein